MLVGPDESGIYYNYIPEITDGNKTLHFIVNPLSKENRRQISSRDLRKSETFEGTYFCSAVNRGGLDRVFTRVEMKENDSNPAKWAGIAIPAILVVAVMAMAAFFWYHK